jgi:hypothetical protein
LDQLIILVCDLDRAVRDYETVKFAVMQSRSGPPA